MYLSFLDSVIFAFFDFFTRTTNIGLSDKISKENRHGVFFGKDINNKQVMIPFTVDYPQVLKRPNFFTVFSLFMQIEQLGFVPEHIEIGKDQDRRIYRCGKRQPIFVQHS